MVSQVGNTRFSQDLVGQSAAMQRLRSQISSIAPHDVGVLLQGESGTGKELVARSIHSQSRRAAGPFIGVNCAAIHESLLESELFGHEAGSFTGARTSTVGFLRAANGGTIFLDEIGDMSDALQTKLLRVLEERTVVPVGGTHPVPLDIRVIAATHRNLSQAVAEGSFRTDLYYRINVVCLMLPALRDRPEDIPLLAEHFLGQVGETLKVPRKTLSPSALDMLADHSWPGNVRELNNAVQRAYVLSVGPVIQPEDLPPEMARRQTPETLAFPTLREAAGRHVELALQLSGNSRSLAAQMLGVDRKTLWRLMRRHKLTETKDADPCQAAKV
jgi:two-component system, NtrC family, response regulator HydG